MSKWFRYENTLVNLDKCARVVYARQKQNWRIAFYDHNNLDPTTDGDQYHDHYIDYLTEDEALLNFNKIVELVTNKDELTKLKETISKQNDEIAELRKMIIHLPVVGNVFIEAKDEFEATLKIDN
jgi:hypothetical protein